jgi:hypothetical protein
VQQERGRSPARRLLRTYLSQKEIDRRYLEILEEQQRPALYSTLATLHPHPSQVIDLTSRDSSSRSRSRSRSSDTDDEDEGDDNDNKDTEKGKGNENSSSSSTTPPPPYPLLLPYQRSYGPPGQYMDLNPPGSDQ